jgi:hypothetical protein
MSCKLKLDFVDPDNPNAVTREQKAERENNNLHIWELGEVLKKLYKIYSKIYPGTDKPQTLGYKILAPEEIAELYRSSEYGAVKSLSEANIIAALNGPMAHIYVKDRTGNDWSTHGRIVEDIGYFAEVIRLLFSKDKTPSNLPDIFPESLIEYVLFDTLGLRAEMGYSVDAILVRKSVAEGEKYCVYKGIKADKSDIECDSLKGYFNENDYVKAVERINGVENQNRSGDIILIMNDKTTGDAINRYTTGSACKSWHGSLNPSDSYVPLILSYPGGNRTEIEKIVDRHSVDTNAQSICPNLQCDGNWKVTDIIKEIIRTQYQE